MTCADTIDNQGTPYFVSVEADNQLYAFEEEDSKFTTPVGEIPIDNWLGDSEIENVPYVGTTELTPLTPFRHNPLHDLESLWWIAVYFVVKRVAYRTNPNKVDTKWTSHAQRAYATELFSCNATRYFVMKRASDFRSKMNIVHPSVKPIVLILSDLRDMLASRYTKAEKNAASIEYTCADGLHEKFIRAFTLISQAKKLQEIELVPFDHEPKEAKSKPSEENYNPLLSKTSTVSKY